VSEGLGKTRGRESKIGSGGLGGLVFRGWRIGGLQAGEN